MSIVVNFNDGSLPIRKYFLFKKDAYKWLSSMSNFYRFTAICIDSRGITCFSPARRFKHEWIFEGDI